MGQVLSSLEIIVTAHYNLSKGLSMLFRDERYLCKIAVFLFLCISPNCLLSNEKVIYGKDNRKDLYEITDSKWIDNAQAVAALIPLEHLKKSDDGSVKVLNGGVEEDINVYLGKLKNPGSGYEHHFKPSAQAGMGAKPTTGTAGAAGIANPWLEGSINLTRQMALEATDPDLAAVLKREAGK